MSLQEIQALAGVDRLVLSAELAPAFGSLIYPTSFMNMGAATYPGPDGRSRLLVESVPSIANRLEDTAWDPSDQRPVELFSPLPHVRVEVIQEGSGRPPVVVSSRTESHRLASAYIERATDAESGGPLRDTILEQLAAGIRSSQSREVGLAHAVLRLDPFSVLHGVYFSQKPWKVDSWQPRLLRVVSGVIEAADVTQVPVQGMRRDDVEPSSFPGHLAKDGFGNVPALKVWYAAEEIHAYFHVDLARLRAYWPGGGQSEQAARDLLAATSLWQIRRFLETGLRLRSDCVLELKDGAGAIQVIRGPSGWEVPSAQALEGVISEAVDQLFPEGGRALKGTYTLPASKKADEEPEPSVDLGEEEED